MYGIYSNNTRMYLPAREHIPSVARLRRVAQVQPSRSTVSCHLSLSVTLRFQGTSLPYTISLSHTHKVKYRTLFQSYTFSLSLFIYTYLGTLTHLYVA